jgi:uncharacterized protein involved in exopolysaccharide biosynthesis
MTDLFESGFQEDQSGGNLLEQLPAILRDRRWWVIGPAIAGVLGAVLVGLLMPPVYQSSALMLVESSQLPETVVGDTTGEQIERRLARIKEQVTSRPSLLKIIEQHGLYARERRTEPLSEVIDRVRDAISITPQLSSQDRGNKKNDAIAFQLSFEYREPVATQAVTQDLMDNILELDYSGSREQATGTVQFLTDQASELQQKIAQLQENSAAIKAQNGLALASPNLTIAADPASYDLQIAALQRDNATLLSQKSIARTSDERSPLVVQAEAALAAARASYSETHPDVVLARQRLAEARELAKQNVAKLPMEGIDQQIANNNAQIAALNAAKQRAQSQIGSQLSAQARAPLVQQQIAELDQQLSVLNTQYAAVQDQLLAAKTGVRADDEQLNERLSVVDPPVVPDSPLRPNRLLIAAIGIAAGLAIGIVLALAVELLLRPIRDPKTLQAITGAPPLSVVPVISDPDTPGEPGRRFPFPSWLRKRAQRRTA